MVKEVPIEEYRDSWILQAVHEPPKELVIASIGQKKLSSAMNEIADVIRKNDLTLIQAEALLDAVKGRLRSKVKLG